MLNFIWRVPVFVSLSILICGHAAWAGDDAPPQKPSSIAAASDEPAPLRWHQELDVAIGESRRLGKPVLVRASAKWCLWCRKLDTEIAKPDVQKAISEWVLVEIDTDENPDDARRLNIGPIPALRILGPDGHLAASREGFQTAEKLIAWLNSYDKDAETDAPFQIKDIKELNPQTVVRLVRQLSHRDANVREALIPRLSTDKALAAVDVVKAFAEGNLATRLAALELLGIWKAPVKDVDPWQPETITEEFLADLDEWANEQAAMVLPTNPEPEPLTPEVLEEARLEISKLVSADLPEAESIIARLSRFGNALLPEVREQRLRAESDKSRVRLDWLRFRLTATDALALKWPGGLMRLASTDARTRHDAVAELAKQVTSGDEPLLLELFSHSDPFVRELSLKALHGVEGARATSELSRLLHDPEPNVRAAVLKQLSENPSPKMVPQIADYVAGEKDPDLIVHAVRLLRVITGPEAVDCLIKLLAHTNWQVRAEAVDALGKVASNTSAPVRRKTKSGAAAEVSDESGANPTKETRLDPAASASAALREMLSDQDSFVVSRAVQALKNSHSGSFAEPLAKAAERHPDLAREISEFLSIDHQIRAEELAMLKSWLRHSDDRFRAAAIASLFRVAELDGATELIPALSDPSDRVRLSAAAQVLAFCDKQRPRGAYVIDGEMSGLEFSGRSIPMVAEFDDEDAAGSHQPKVRATEPTIAKSVLGLLFGTTDDDESLQQRPEKKSGVTADKKSKTSEDAVAQKTIREQRPHEDWLIRFRAGENRDEWLGQAIEPLRQMFLSQSVPEQVAAGVALVSLGADEGVIPVLVKAAESDAIQMTAAAKALNWLPWEQRAGYFDQLVKVARDPSEVSAFCSELVVLRDLRSSELLWKILSGEQVNAALAESVFANLRSNHRFPEPYSNSTLPPIGVDVEKLQILARDGEKWQQRVAFAFLLIVDKSKATEAAQTVYQNPRTTAAIRRDAFNVLLKASRKKESQRLAIAGLASTDSVVVEQSLAFLTLGESAVTSIADGSFSLESDHSHLDFSNDEPKDIPLPKGISADNVRPLLTSPNEDIAAQAAFVLVMLGEPQELDRLINRWRKAGADTSPWQQLVYKAIAASKDPRRVPVLEEIYRSLQDLMEIKQFYWAIRSMQGPEVLRLRKRIRDDVGVQNLR